MESLGSPGLDETRNLRGRGIVPYVFVLLGIGTLLPWNAFISAKPYFQSRLNTNSNFMLWFGFIYNAMGTLSLAFMILKKIFFGGRNTKNDEVAATISENGKTENLPRYQLRTVVLPLAVFLTIFLFTSCLVLIKSIEPSIFLLMTLLSIAICGSASAMTGAGVIFVASIFPPQEAVNPYVSGQSAGGVIISAINLITAALDKPKNVCESDHNNIPSNPSRLLSVDVAEAIGAKSQTFLPYQIDLGAFAYFGLCSLILGLCILSYIALEHLPVTKYYRSQAKEKSSQSKEADPSNSMLFRDNNLPPEPQNSFNEDNENYSQLAELLLPSNHSQPNVSATQKDEKNITVIVWKSVQQPALAIFFTFVVTLTLFPSWITKVQSVQMCQSNSRIFKDLFVPLSILLFNVGDLVGRMLAKGVSVDRSKKFTLKLLIASLARIVFFPLLLLCNVPGKSFSFSVNSDFFFYFLLMSFAISNGLIVTLAFMIAPQLLPPDDEMQEVASTILTFAVSIGLLSGSSLSFLFNLIGTGKLA